MPRVRDRYAPRSNAGGLTKSNELDRKGGTRNVDVNLHQKMGIHHLNRVLGYSQFVMKDGRATVHLTPEDWQVVADTLFAMNTARELLPEPIRSYRLAHGNRIIELTTADGVIEIDVV